MYAYCENNPVLHADTGGYWVETAFDIVSLANSVKDVIADPSSFSNWIFLLGDTVDVAVPLFGGVGETMRAFKAAGKVGDLKEACESTLNTIKEAATFLRKGENWVYYSKNADDIIDYVGITNSFDRRASEWERYARGEYERGRGAPFRVTIPPASAGGFFVTAVSFFVRPDHRRETRGMSFSV